VLKGYDEVMARYTLLRTEAKDNKLILERQKIISPSEQVMSKNVFC
jgi:hypothetical protein